MKKIYLLRYPVAASRVVKMSFVSKGDMIQWLYTKTVLDRAHGVQL